MPRPTSDVQAFEAHATDADLDDLRARLARRGYRRPRRSIAPRPTLADGNRAFLSPTSSMSLTTGAPGTTGGRSKSALTASASSARPLMIWESTSCTADPRVQMPLL